MQMAHALSLLKLAVIALVLLGVDPFRYLGTHTPAPFVWMLNNKLYSCLMLFFVCGAIESKLVSTGAFEIYFNDVRVWSKIETGRIPSPPELFQIIDNQPTPLPPHGMWQSPRGDRRGAVPQRVPSSSQHEARRGKQRRLPAVGGCTPAVDVGNASLAPRPVASQRLPASPSPLWLCLSLSLFSYFPAFVQYYCGFVQKSVYVMLICNKRNDCWRCGFLRDCFCLQLPRDVHRDSGRSRESQPEPQMSAEEITFVLKLR
ncbi:hypothetical protein IscW_ISCW006093 [Ixodes scapularis]|uniref:Uncharacterized protein n=1 Tax=Ixodes scapularis TaxID=6945 RepID=B7PP77_IXOSC|nr:hypothetical protein IscW_ISCW006093 [Ixodes scapularis]|eukprot:XP_002435569.1 hypothetical protein IscW_ISCW006093 [Ixodes scapularis]